MSQLRLIRGRFAYFAAAWVGLLLTSSTFAFSHHPSGVSSSGTSGPILTIPGTALMQGSVTAWIAFEHISFDELSDAVLEQTAAAHEHVHSLRSIESPAGGFAYGLSDRLMVSLQLPYVIRTGIREGEHQHILHGPTEMVVNEVVDRGESKGIGDLSVLGQYRFTGERSGPQASLLFGVKTPTGATDERDDEGELFETEFQPGSGSWDGLFGLALTQAMGRWSLDGNVLYTVATEGAQDTDLGDRFQYNGAVSYRLIGASLPGATERHHEHHHNKGHHHEHRVRGNGGLAVDAVLEVNGDWQAKQDIAGETDPNSGGNVVFLSPGVRLTSNAWSGFVSLGLPIVNDLNGQQSEPEYRLVGGIAASF
jgi:hypothetical protein